MEHVVLQQSKGPNYQRNKGGLGEANGERKREPVKDKKRAEQSIAEIRGELGYKNNDKKAGIEISESIKAECIGVIICGIISSDGSFADFNTVIIR